MSKTILSFLPMYLAMVLFFLASILNAQYYWPMSTWELGVLIPHTMENSHLTFESPELNY